MATKSFLKENVIENEQEAVLFLEALEKAEKVAANRKKVNVSYKDVKDKKEIKRIFSKMEK